MTIYADNIKNLLVNNGLNPGTPGNNLEELAQEISESIEGLSDRRSIADTIYGNLVASGVSYRDVDNLMGVAERITNSIYTSDDNKG